MKTCNKCQQSLPYSEFYKHKPAPDGYRYSCKRCYNAGTRVWQANNMEQFNAVKQVYRENNREGAREYSAEHYQTNREKRLEQGKQWRKDNPENYKEIYRRFNGARRARLAGVPNTMPKDWWNILLDTYGPACMNPECSHDLDEFNMLTHDHVIPISQEGSTHSLSNSQILCFRCNSAKSNRGITDYRPFIITEACVILEL
jgi:5-methylcytosine-specific restriction endonuclease McrA